MEIGKKLKDARTNSGLTQENVAERAGVSRQTVSNWENGRSYPDIVSVIKLSDIYSISLDELLKGDNEMIEHLKESTNVVRSNKKLIAAIIANIMLLVLLLAASSLIAENYIFMVGIFALAVISSSLLFYQIIKKF